MPRFAIIAYREKTSIENVADLERSDDVALRRLQVTCAVCALVFLLTNPGCTVFQQDSDAIHPAKSLPPRHRGI